MRFLDVTRPIHPAMPVFPGDPRPRLDRIADPGQGEPARVSILHVGTHTGTHVDAPCHLPGLAGGIEALPIPPLVGPAIVAGLGSLVTPAALTHLPAGVERLLLRGAPVMEEDAAAACVDRGVRLVGTDGLSIDPMESRDLPAHRVLLRAGVIVVENLDLSAAPDGPCWMAALPLLIPEADGAPARVILRFDS